MQILINWCFSIGSFMFSSFFILFIRFYIPSFVYILVFFIYLNCLFIYSFNMFTFFSWCFHEDLCKLSISFAKYMHCSWAFVPFVLLFSVGRSFVYCLTFIVPFVYCLSFIVHFYYCSSLMNILTLCLFKKI